LTILLKIEKLSAWYGDSCVLKEVDIEINDGEIVALLGRNGMGKTTTLHSVCGIIEKISGNIFYNKNFISNLPSYEISKLGIGLVPEGRRIFSNLTVEENLIVASRKGYWDLNKIKQIFGFNMVYRSIRWYNKLFSWISFFWDFYWPCI